MGEGMMIAQNHDHGNGNGRGRLPAHREPIPACDRCAPVGASAPHEELASLLPELERIVGEILVCHSHA